MIVIVDYGMGNLRSVQKGFERIGSKALVSRDIRDINSATKLVLPGVGAFPECMKNLTKFGLVESILDFLKSNKPFLGICLGLQLLFDESEEFGLNRGLEVIHGKVKAFDREMGLKIPHMGWNQVIFKKDIAIFDGIDNESYFYFVHSYYVEPEQESDTAAQTDYGITFTSAIARGNVFALQFHPEKSQKNGLKILENFSKL
ncbi:MAG: imidazole glycerol phosphate synthase subunit HisH [Deltaproteobacteria bacterium]|nr:imidazole glycerol phosphate synthase subunit HisH [Deltaproteobacteria bacterium]